MSHKHERQKSKVNLTKIAINFLSILQIQMSNVKDSHVETDANSEFTFLFKPKNCQSYTLLKFDSGKREIQSLHQSKHPKVWHLLKYCLSVHLQGGVDLESQAKCSRSSKGWNISWRMTRSHRCSRCSHSSKSHCRLVVQVGKPT